MPNDVPDWTGVNVYTEAPVPGSPFTVPRDGFTHDLGTINLSAGIESIGLLFSNPADFIGVQVTGSISGFNYAGNSFIGTGNPITVGLFRTIDPSIDLKVTPVSSGGNATVSAVLLYSGRLVTIDQQQQSAVIIQDSANHLVGTELGPGGKRGLNVTQDGAFPALWQAPQKLVSIEANGATIYTLVTGAVGQKVYVFGWVLVTEAPAATGAFARIRDGSIAGGSANGTIATVPNGAGAINEEASGNHGGVPITSGASLVLDAASINTFVRCAVGISQG